MKFFVIFFIFSGAYGKSKSAVDNWNAIFQEDTAPFGLLLEDAVAKKFTNVNGVNYKEKAANNFNNCTNGILPNLESFHPHEEHEVFCRYKQKEIFVCVKNYAMDLLPQLDTNEEYLQNFLPIAYKYGIDELCGADGFSNTQYIMNTFFTNNEEMSFGNPCGNSLEWTFDIQLNGKCLTDLNIFKDLNTGVLNLQRNSICNDIKPLQSCLIRFMKEKCYVDFSIVFELMFKPFLKACKINVL